MASRMAACLSLIVFAFCLILGMGAGNTFSTTVGRALVALAGTYVIGLVLGHIAMKMLDENLKAQEEKLRNDQSPPPPDDR